jgi:hypothetical protein
MDQQAPDDRLHLYAVVAQLLYPRQYIVLKFFVRGHSHIGARDADYVQHE